MKATELRIRGYYKAPIKFKGSVSAQINFIEDRMFILTKEILILLLSLNLEQLIKPVPLTEEWLLKFGFETRLINNCFLEYYLSCTPPKYKKDYVLRWWDANNERRIFWSPVLSGTIHHFPCKYVHQLQNLYFALTGNELEIK